MVNGWTPQRRAHQSKMIHKWKPWVHSTGARTPQGKAKSKMNSYRYGGHTEYMRKMSRFITECRRSLNAIK